MSGSGVCFTFSSSTHRKGMNVGNMWRVGPDHIPIWWEPESGQDPGTSGGTAQIIQHFAGKSSFAGPGGWNDPDFLMPGN